MSPRKAAHHVYLAVHSIASRARRDAVPDAATHTIVPTAKSASVALSARAEPDLGSFVAFLQSANLAFGFVRHVFVVGQFDIWVRSSCFCGRPIWHLGSFARYHLSSLGSFARYHLSSLRSFARFHCPKPGWGSALTGLFSSTAIASFFAFPAS
jgi:hypothetical protein